MSVAFAAMAKMTMIPKMICMNELGCAAKDVYNGFIKIALVTITMMTLLYIMNANHVGKLYYIILCYDLN